jgi:rod shape-determining protein MreD
MMIKGDLLNRGLSINLDIDVIAIIIVYLLGHRCETGAGIFALGQGLLMDVFSGGIWGLNTLLYVLVYLFIKIIARPFDLLSVIGQVAVTFFGVLVKDFFIILLFLLFSLNSGFSWFDALLLLASAGCSGLAAPFIIILLNSIFRGMRGIQKGFNI